MRQLQKYRLLFDDFQEFVAKLEQAQNGQLVPIEVIKRKHSRVLRKNQFIDFLWRTRLFEFLLLSVLFIFYRTFKLNISKANREMTNKKTKNYELIRDLKVGFADVAGMRRPKQELTEFVEFLRDNSRFKELGAEMPKGALMTGPPGVGKTFLAKAMAGEAGVAFFYVSGSEFVEKYVGVGASRVRELFKQARKKSPAVIFIDEIDAVAQKRSESLGNTESMNTLNQLLVEMDGFDTDSQVVVIGSTNLKEVLDPALLRPGRFDRLIEIGYPSLEEREEIFAVYLAKVILDQSQGRNLDFYKQKLATLTPGFTGADISNIVNEVSSNKRLQLWLCASGETTSMRTASKRPSTKSSPASSATSSKTSTKNGRWRTTKWATRWSDGSWRAATRCSNSPFAPAPKAPWALHSTSRVKSVCGVSRTC